MSESMVERVGLAVRELIRDKTGIIICNINEDIGRTAIAAMREPTEAMIDAGEATGVCQECHADPEGSWHEWTEYDLAHAWKTMIDEALR